MLRLHNTASHKLEKFKPIHSGQVNMYTCGPTIYDFAHIGNLSVYLLSDLLKKYLQFSGYKVLDVMNFTDVDDKTIKASHAQGVPLSQYTQKFGQAILDDFDKLKISRPKVICEATKHIPDMIKLIQTLLDKGYAYQAKDKSVYYKISAFKDYGKFAGINKRQLKTGASGRINSDEYQKDNAGDFVLWKAWDKDDGQVFWDSPFGKGRPGWHIECSAMSMKYLGPSFDIHLGGEDLIFPHHQNEIAQSEGATGQKFVNYWLHHGFLRMSQKKMSKSLGNLYTLSQILEKVPNPMAFRYLILTSHYRKALNFSFDILQSAQNTLDKFSNFIARLRQQQDKSLDTTDNQAKTQQLIDIALTAFTDFMDDDLNTPQAIASLFNFINQINKMIDNAQVGPIVAQQVLDFLKKIDKVWAFIFPDKKFDPKNEDATQIGNIIKQRDLARQNQDWSKADNLKQQLDQMGVEIQDNPTGTSWKWKKQ
ncbi:cysteine--tRNA ligase [Candidatus Shapirobacteria bacterium]|nr:MAG: cysteine--tRNA ligase [Candidatus Shapirobacteria bacterium]